MGKQMGRGGGIDLPPHVFVSRLSGRDYTTGLA